MIQKFLIISITLSVSNLAFAQSDQVVIAQPDYNILYAGCANTVQVGRKDGITDFVLQAEGMDIQLQDPVSSIYIFTPRGKDRISLYFLNNTQTDTLDFKEFRVLPLPPAEIYLGDAKNGEILTNRTASVLSLKLPAFVTVNANMTIADWSASLDDDKKLFYGEGQQLSVELMEKIKNAPKGAVLHLEVAYKTNGKGIKRQKLTFTL
jgi:hypothetical protein